MTRFQSISIESIRVSSNHQICSIKMVSTASSTISELHVVQGPGNCTKCAHVKDGSFCVAECHIFQYPDSNGTCQMCYKNCNKDKGCTGPGSHLGYGGCNQCAQLVMDFERSTGNNTMCIDAEKSECDIGYYGLHRVTLTISASADPKNKTRVYVVRKLIVCSCQIKKKHSSFEGR